MKIPRIHFNKTRIAPTPSGFLHVGNILSFSITAALARKHGAKILLRIDDLDRARVNLEYLTDIFDTLRFLEIPWDEGPQDTDDFESRFSQIHRMQLYNEALDQLVAGDFVFACTCSRKQMSETGSCTCSDKQIPLNTPEASWRLRTDNAATLQVKSYNDKIILTQLPAEMENFVVRKKDGFPAYQLTSVIDDLFYGVDLIVRGEDLWASTLAQIQVATVLEKQTFNDIVFYHHPLLLEADGKKLSKSAGSTSIRYLSQEGKSAEDVFMLISDLCSLPEKANNWQELAASILRKLS
ncbi:glutamate--tRNA ligase family protein [Mucilaginibacter gossypii]|uniref:glutamate--tRNA ligase family protein n=1 Tax=Mucilaginibacter gossypii TaxID=551996 RepID=UPI000DCE21B3|nr:MULTISPECIES: glutamate--tRNA ligase family protein [Mucilaginibacter]QTE35913.1 glutamate--tRNA ligase family protein [Mucilaginibacter gossypii]RAV54718.1 tRNA glutamyl-Q synthetase [Mucilaginibacter rubeus]